MTWCNIDTVETGIVEQKYGGIQTKWNIDMVEHRHSG